MSDFSSVMQGQGELSIPDFIEANYLIRPKEGGAPIPMKFSAIQRDIMEHIARNMRVLKPRQGWVTNGFLAYFTELLRRHANWNALVVFDSLSRTQSARRAVEIFLNSTRTPVDASRTEYIEYGNGSVIRFATGRRGAAVGLAQTIHCFLLSEPAEFDDELGLRQVLEKATSAIPPHVKDTIMVVEGVAGQHGSAWHKEWNESANNPDVVRLFYEWFKVAEYTYPKPEELGEGMKPLDYWLKADLEEDEERLAREEGVTLEQIAYRRWQRDTQFGGDITRYLVEFPEDDQSWFMAGGGLFDSAVTKRRKDAATEGYIANTRWGPIEFWVTEPDPKEQYVIGVDCAAGLADSDYSVVQVISWRAPSQHVARFRDRVPPDVTLKVAGLLSTFFNRGLIVTEGDTHGRTGTQVLYNSPGILYETPEGPEYEGFNMFYEDQDSGKYEKPWLTAHGGAGEGSRFERLTETKGLWDTEQLVSRDIETIDEAAAMIKKHGNRVGEAPPGGHDDLVMALSLCVFGRNEIRPEAFLEPKTIHIPNLLLIADPEKRRRASTPPW